MGNRIVPGWSAKPAGRHVRPAGFAMLAAAALLTAVPAQSTAAAAPVADAQASRVNARPLWVTYGNDRAALRLIGLLQSAELDGLSPKPFKANSLKKAVRAAARGNPSAMAKANEMLDRALLAYVTALRRAPTTEWIINDREAVPSVPSASVLLAQAAAAPSLEAWVDSMGFMHHSYAELRRALAFNRGRGDGRAEALLRVNLGRARFLPASGRYVLVNTAAQRLYMYENGQVIDWMRVVVGKPQHATPMMAATIKFTALNPYWNLPSDLAAERIAPNVVKDGVGFLREKGYVALSDWGEKARPINPSTIDWEAVAAGRVLVRLRQNPGPGNAMGRMKFMFPNPQGIYLHDTPDKQLLNEAARLFSGGCVRLEDAPRLAKWLYGKPLNTKGARTEQPVKLPQPMPVYMAYLTAVPSGGNQIVFYEDIYGKDRVQLAVKSDRRIARR